MHWESNIDQLSRSLRCKAAPMSNSIDKQLSSVIHYVLDGPFIEGGKVKRAEKEWKKKRKPVKSIGTANDWSKSSSRTDAHFRCTSLFNLPFKNASHVGIFCKHILSMWSDEEVMPLFGRAVCKHCRVPFPSFSRHHCRHHRSCCQRAEHTFAEHGSKKRKENSVKTQLWTTATANLCLLLRESKCNTTEERLDMPNLLVKVLYLCR